MAMDIMDIKRPGKEMDMPFPEDMNEEESAALSDEEMGELEDEEASPALADATDTQLLDECQKRGLLTPARGA